MNLQNAIAYSLLSIGVASSGASSGCAFGDRHVYLKYESPISTSSVRNPIDLKMGEFESKLQLTENGEQKIGRVRNGYGWETAKVLAKNNPAAWLKDALIKE